MGAKVKVTETFLGGIVIDEGHLVLVCYHWVLLQCKTKCRYCDIQHVL